MHRCLRRDIVLVPGGGIVFDSDPYEEWMETMNKLGANMQCIGSAEERYLRMEGDDSRPQSSSAEVNGRRMEREPRSVQ